jgi:hypothetical protein
MPLPAPTGGNGATRSRSVPFADPLGVSASVLMADSSGAGNGKKGIQTLFAAAGFPPIWLAFGRISGRVNVEK